MKVYFAYRTGYKSNHRFIKAFEADGILDFFQKHWEQFAKDATPIIGDVYSFPFYYDKEDGDTLQTPNDFEQLTKLLKSYVYCNEVLGDENCLEVHTDDDEIELAWYVFTENYKNANMDKVALWFYDTLPSDIDNSNANFKASEVMTLDVSDKDKVCYLMSSAIYDSGNLEDMQFIKIKGTDLKHIISDLKGFDFNAIKDDDYLPYGIEELHILTAIAQEFNLDDLQAVIDKFNDYPTLIDNGISDKTDWQNLQINDEKEKSLIHINEHIAEFGIYSGFNFHYYVLFDEEWANAHPELAKSIEQFGRSWQISHIEDDE